MIFTKKVCFIVFLLPILFISVLISFCLLALCLFLLFFFYILKVGVEIIVLRLTLLSHVFNAVNFLLGTDLAVSHTFWYVLFSFSFNPIYFLFSFRLFL